MKFCDALEQLKNGKCIRREYYPASVYYKVVYSDELHNGSSLSMFFDGGKFAGIYIAFHDMLCDDWEIFNELSEV